MFTTGDENTSWLRTRFAARLLAARPKEVLDVGAGAGALLGILRAAGVPCRGTEPDPERVRALVQGGCDAVCADAAHLPFEDGVFDWVAMRHVPHHLADPARGVAEALRVARRGLLVAEPWYDTSIASQRAALAAERWTKAQERRAGRVHDDNHSADDLLRFAGAHPSATARIAVDVVHQLCLRLRAVEEFEAEAAPWLAGLAADDERRRAYDALLVDARRAGLSWNGSVVVALEKVAHA
jgi:SAM-dependent methyltransferase